jgi:Tol biopolymer transport system component
VGAAELFAPGVASTDFAEIRLTISPDGRTALWFSRNRPGGAGGYDIWMSRRAGEAWGQAAPVSFNSPVRDFDPAFSADERYVYFSSDRPGGLGGDDIYRVAVLGDGFGAAEHLGAGVNSASNEWAAMLSPDDAWLLFSSNRPGGAGRMDLFVATRDGDGSATAAPAPGAVNTPADEFDATYLADGTSIVFSRAPDLQADRIDLVFATLDDGAYGAGETLPLGVNDAQGDTYGPMLNWADREQITFSGRRGSVGGMDLYVVRYSLSHGVRSASP